MATSHLFAPACALILFLSSAAVQAQSAPAPRALIGDHGESVQAFIAQHDGNADGKVTWADFETFRRARFDATDSNGDGTVDETEYVQEFEDRTRQSLEQRRTAEVEQAQVRFGVLDTDKDGAISRVEFDASGDKAFAHFMTMPAPRSGDAKAPANRNASGQGLLPSTHTREGFLSLYDSNGDGKVDRAEFNAVRSEQFRRTDANRNGGVDQDEYMTEFEDRLDRRVAVLSDGSDKQTHVRFGVLDTDKDARMTWQEYQASGKRTFDLVDRNADGVVDAADAALPPTARPQRDAGSRSTGSPAASGV